MADAPPLHFRKVLGSLRPANRAAEEALASLDDRPIRVRITRTSGNTRRNALYWAILGVAAPMLDEQAPGLTVELLHKVLKDKYGLVRAVTLPSGHKVRDYDSTSFAKMTEPDRSKFITWAIITLSNWLNCDVEDLMREGKAA
jgi:hypothetical protein